MYIIHTSPLRDSAQSTRKSLPSYSDEVRLTPPTYWARSREVWNTASHAASYYPITGACVCQDYSMPGQRQARTRSLIIPQACRGALACHPYHQDWRTAQPPFLIQGPFTAPCTTTEERLKAQPALNKANDISCCVHGPFFFFFFFQNCTIGTFQGVGR